MNEVPYLSYGQGKDNIQFPFNTPLRDFIIPLPWGVDRDFWHELDFEITLDEEIYPEKAKASYKDGILKVKILDSGKIKEFHPCYWTHTTTSSLQAWRAEQKELDKIYTV